MLIIGDYTYGADKVRIFGPEKGDVRFGKFCSVASDVTIFLCADHRVDWITTYPFGHVNQSVFTKHKALEHPTSKGDVIIGNDVWIGAGATIMSGVTIGDGAVVAANSHVVKNVDPYSIVGGNPAKHLKYRFDPDTIKRLLEVKWWDLSKEQIDGLSGVLCSPDVNKLLSWLGQPPVKKNIYLQQ
jgi:acetyltransferase-like isoleucine patch superfamily enzyme